MPEFAELWAKIGADTSGLKTGLQDASDGLQGLRDEFANTWGMTDELTVSEAKLTDTQDENTKATKEAAKQQKEYQKGLGDVVKGLTGVSLAQIGVVGGLVAVGKFMKDSVTETVDYNQQLREMSQLTGLGAQEIARIVQVGDDWGISISEIRTSLAYMNKQGITPSIDELAKLADSYVNASDKSAWANENVKTLGRGYQTLIPILSLGGQGVRDATAAISDSLIPTDEAIRKSREYEVAIDDLGDSFTGVKYTVGNEVIPALTGLAKWFNDETAREQFLKIAIDDINAGYINQSQYWNLFKLSSVDMAAAQAELNANLKASPKYLEDHAAALELANEKTRELQRSTDGLNGVLADSQQGYIDYLNSVKGQKVVYDEAAHNELQFRHNLDDTAKATTGAGQAAVIAGEKYDGLGKNLADLKEHLDGVQQAWADEAQAAKDAATKTLSVADAGVDAVKDASKKLKNEIKNMPLVPMEEWATRQYDAIGQALANGDITPQAAENLRKKVQKVFDDAVAKGGKVTVPLDVVVNSKPITGMGSKGQTLFDAVDAGKFPAVEATVNEHAVQTSDFLAGKAAYDAIQNKSVYVDIYERLHQQTSGGGGGGGGGTGSTKPIPGHQGDTGTGATTTNTYIFNNELAYKMAAAAKRASNAAAIESRL